MTDHNGMNTSWALPEQSQLDRIVSVTGLVLSWLKTAGCEQLDTTVHRLARRVVNPVLVELQVCSLERLMTTVSPFMPKPTHSSTATEQT